MRIVENISRRVALACGVVALSAFTVADAGAKFVYIANRNQAIRGFSVDATTGALKQLATPWIVDEFPLDLAASADGTLIYSVNPYSNDIAAFKANTTTGALLQAPTSPYVFPSSSSGAVRMVVHPGGKFAYANARGYDISSFIVDPTTGGLTPTGNPASGGIDSKLEITPNGKFLYAANPGISFLPDPRKTTNKISAFRIDETTGVLIEVPGSPFATGTGPRRLTTDPGSHYLLVSNTDAGEKGDIRVYSIQASTGALTQAGSTLLPGCPNYDIRFAPSGKFVYVTCGGVKKKKPEILVYSFNATNGALTKTQDVVLQIGASLLGIDPGGKFLFAMQMDTKTSISTYTINPGTGALTLSAGPTTVDGDTGVVGMTVLGTP